jgi:hypothetical protein
MKAAAIGTGRNVQCAKERAAHRFAGAETACGGDCVDPIGGFFETAARSLDAQVLDEYSRRRSDFAREHAGEIARAHRGMARERFD